MLLQWRSAPSTGHWLGSPVVAKALHPPCISATCYGVWFRKEWPARAAAQAKPRLLDRNPPKPSELML